METGQHVGHRANQFLDLPFDQFNRPCVQAGASHLCEATPRGNSVRLIRDPGQINARFAAPLDCVPRGLQPGWNTQFLGEHVHRPQRQHSQPRAFEPVGNVTNAIQHFVERPIAARGDHDLKALPDGLGGQPSRVARRGGLPQRALHAEFFEMLAEMSRFVAAGCRVENHACAHNRLFEAGASESRRNLPWAQKRRGVPVKERPQAGL